MKERKISWNQTDWRKLYFYQKADALYQLTIAFCRRFLPAHGDRTVDQMVQAARSGKQNIVEGYADGVTSSEIAINLLNVARGSIKELKEDYLDYLKAHKLMCWTARHPRYAKMLAFCRAHNALKDYEPLFGRCDDETLANCANTLCHMIDRMMVSHIRKMQSEFVELGSAREQMRDARQERRLEQRDDAREAPKLRMLLAQRDREIMLLNLAINRLRGEINALKARTGCEMRGEAALV